MANIETPRAFNGHRFTIVYNMNRFIALILIALLNLYFTVAFSEELPDGDYRKEKPIQVQGIVMIRFYESAPFGLNFGYHLSERFFLGGMYLPSYKYQPDPECQRVSVASKEKECADNYTDNVRAAPKGTLEIRFSPVRDVPLYLSIGMYISGGYESDTRIYRHSGYIAGNYYENTNLQIIQKRKPWIGAVFGGGVNEVFKNGFSVIGGLLFAVNSYLHKTDYEVTITSLNNTINEEDLKEEVDSRRRPIPTFGFDILLFLGVGYNF